MKFAMDQTLLVKGHSHAVFPEEDLLPALTFLHLFESTMWLLDEDPSLWCISAWNDNGPLPHGRDESLLSHRLLPRTWLAHEAPGVGSR